MSEFKIDLKPEDVNKAITTAVLGSVVGKQIIEGIEKRVKDLTTGTYNNPIENAITGIVVEIVKEEVLKRKNEIKGIIADKITTKLIEDAVKKFASFLENKY